MKKRLVPRSLSEVGFTLIELLVVIAILGVLASLLVPNFMGVRERARDTQRKSDLHNIAKALELYRQDQLPVAYPANNSFLSTKDACWSSGVNCTGNIYIRRIPVDPSSTTTIVAYSYTTVDNTEDFTLCACLENVADSAAVAGNCADYTCSSGYKYEVNEP